jgi:hypothetical protein
VTLYWGERDTKTITSLYGSHVVPARPSDSSRDKIKTWDGGLNKNCGILIYCLILRSVIWNGDLADSASCVNR